jgi:hypothetical protein
VPRNPIVAVIDEAIAKLERELTALRSAREVLA